MTAAQQPTGLLVLGDHHRACVMGVRDCGSGNSEVMLAQLTEAMGRFTRAAR